MASIGCCCEGDNSTYQTLVGTSTSFFGPYYSKDGGRMLENAFNVILLGNYNFVCIGHNARIIGDKGGRAEWFIMHILEYNPKLEELPVLIKFYELEMIDLISIMEISLLVNNSDLKY